MTNNNKHHFQKPVLHQQSDPAIVQLLPTSGLARSDTRANNHHPAGMPRITPLDAENGISRASARHPADRIGERPHHPMHKDHRVTDNSRYRPDAVPTHTRQSEPNEDRDSRRRRVVTLIHFDSRHKSESRANITHPGTGAHTRTSGEPSGRGAPIDPDNSRRGLTPAERPLGGVRQDKDRFSSDREASAQPAAVEEFTRSQAANNTVVRSQYSSDNRRTVPVQVWVHPLVKAELARIAALEGSSLSAAGGAFLEKALQSHVDMQYGALLSPVIEKAIAGQMRGIATRLSWLLVRVAYDCGQTRGIATNILGRQPGMNQDLLKSILADSAKSTRANITRRTPQITELIDAVEKWVLTEDRGENKI